MAASRDLGGDPPESTRLRIGDDISWSDVSAIYDRDDSLKENTNPKCLIKNHPGHNGGGGGGASQRFSGNLKPTAAPIIGIAGKLGQGGGGCGGRRMPPPAMFPRKAKTGGGGRKPKPAVPDDEPGSPKISCIGKVLSDRERERARRRRPARSPEATAASGCCGAFGFFLRRSRSRKSAVDCVDQYPPPPPPPPPASAKRTEVEAAAAAAPGLGGMSRFASGRRAADWTAGIDVEERVARSGPL